MNRKRVKNTFRSTLSTPQNCPHTNYSRQRYINIKPRFKSSVKFKKNACRFSDKKHPVDFAVVKELDEETNLYYYGARYLDPRTSRWIAGDPAIWQGDYIPVAPVNDEARKHNQNLPGMGGIFNMVNMHAYHYAGNNPVKYVDPTGRSPTLPRLIAIAGEINRSGYAKLPGQTWSQGIPLYTRMVRDGCFARASIIANLLRNEGYTVHYAVANSPLIPNTEGERYNYHIAPAVFIDSTWYIIDPYHYGIIEGTNTPGLVNISDWARRQDVSMADVSIMLGYTNDGNILENRYIREMYRNFNNNDNMEIDEYSRRLLEYYNNTGSIYYDGRDF